MHYGFYFTDIEYDYEEYEDVPETVKTPEIEKVFDAEYKCLRCGDWHQGVRPNQDDGTFKCFLCTKYPFR